jgi:hypothetical protein
LRQVEPPKDLGEDGNANDRAVTSAGFHIRLGPHAKIHKSFYRNRWSRHQAIWALEVGRDAWILSGKIKALPVKHIDLLTTNIGYSAD